MYGYAALHESHNLKNAGFYTVMTTSSDFSPVTPSWQFVYITILPFRQAAAAILNKMNLPAIKLGGSLEVLLLLITKDLDLAFERIRSNSFKFVLRLIHNRALRTFTVQMDRVEFALSGA